MKKSTRQFFCLLKNQILQLKLISTLNILHVRSLVLLFCLLSFAGISFANHPDETIAWKSPMLDDGRRYLALMFTNDNEDDQYLDVIENAHNKGFNALYLTVRMDAVKCHNQQCVIGSSINPSWNPANRSWTQTDAQIAKAKQLGMKIGIRVHLGNSDFGGNIRSNYLWGPGRLAEDQNGNTELGGWNFTKFTLSSQPAIDSAKSFVQEVLNRYGYLEGEGNLLFVSFSNTSSQELEYDGSNMIDYSTASKNEYASWYLTNYGVPNPNVPTDFTSTEGKKWYKFRHCKLKDFVGQLSGVVRNHNSSIKIIHDVGSAFDGMSSKRGTLGFKSLAEHSDGFKVNDDFHYDHRFSMDILRGSLPGKFVMNEAFLVDYHPGDFYKNFANDVFTHGGKLLSVVTVNNGYLNQYSGDWSSISSQWLAGSNGNMSAVNANGTVNYSFDEILNASFSGNEFSTGSRNIYGEWETQYVSNPSNGKPVNVVLDDSELSCSSCTPPSAPTLNASPDTITSGNSSTLTATGCSGTVTWSHGLGTGTSKSVSPTSTTTYTATCTVDGCTSTAGTVKVTVNPLPGGEGGCVVNKVRLVFRQPEECCMDRLQGAKIQGSNNGSSWTDLYTFSMNGNGSWQEVTFTNTTSYSWVRFVAGPTGYGELYELEFYNGSTKLSGTVFGAGGGTYAHAFDGILSTDWHAWPTPGSGNYVGLQLSDCDDEACITPAAPVLTASPATITSGNSSTLTATGCSGTVTWSHGLGTGTSKSVSPTSTTTYTATCTIDDCVSSNASVVVNVDEPTGGPFSQCLESESSTGNGAITSDPNASNGETRGEQGNNNHYVDYAITGVPSAGTYSVTLRYYSSAAPTVAVSVNSGTPQTINLANSGSWNIVHTDHTFSVSLSAGSNTLRIQGIGGGSCRQDKICVSNGSSAVLGLEPVDLNSSNKTMSLYPNPSNGLFQTNFYLEKGKKATLSVTDIQGRIVYQQQIIGHGYHRENINVANKASGTMMLRLITDKGIEVKKFNVTK